MDDDDTLSIFDFHMIFYMFEGSFGLVVCDDDLSVSGMLDSNRRLAKQGVHGVLYVV